MDYGVSDLELNFCGIIYTFTFVPMTFVGMWLYKVMAVQNVIRLSCCIILTGCWFRVFTGVNNAFWPVLAGQVIISLAYPLVTNVMTRFSNTWFPDTERSIVTSILGLSIPTGNLVAFLMSGFIFAGIETQDQKGVQDMLMRLLLCQCVWMTIVLIPFIFLIREKPEHPPSLIVGTNKKETGSFCSILKEALKLPNYLKLTCAYALL